MYRLLKARGVPVKLFWFCGGHGQCGEGNGGAKGTGLDVGSIIGSGGGDPKLEAASAAWLARYLKGDRSVRTGPEFEFRSDDGNYRAAPQYPVAPAKPVRAKGAGSLSITRGATSGGQALAAPVTAGALDVPIRVKKRSHLLGPPKVTLTYRGTGAPTDARVYVQLVNLDRGVVVGNQPTPIPVRLDGRRRKITRRLVPITSTAPAGGRYALQLVAGTAVWVTQRAQGTLKASRVAVELPVADPRGLGSRGRRCTTDRSMVIRPTRRLRRKLVGGRILLGRRQVGSLRASAKGGRVRFGRRLEGRQRLRLVLRLADGRTVTQRRTVLLCASHA